VRDQLYSVTLSPSTVLRTAPVGLSTFMLSPTITGGLTTGNPGQAWLYSTLESSVQNQMHGRCFWKATMLAITATYRTPEIYVFWNHTVGIDLGGTTVRTGLYNHKWELLECITLPTRVLDGPQAVVEDVSSCVSHLATKYGARPTAIGLGSPGPLNIPEGRLMRLPNFPGWDGFPLRSALERATGLKVLWSQMVMRLL